VYPRDRELGVQVMDLVYADAKLGIALTTTQLLVQEEVDTLAQLLSGEVFVGGSTKSSPLKIKPDVDVPKVQLLILKILSDPRWSRAWIFQEDYLSDYRMILVIPHAEELDRCKTYDFGNVLGELQVKVHRFRECVTAFCLAQPGRLLWPSTKILQKAKRYVTYNSTDREEYPTTTRSVLFDICGRAIEKEQDGITILANALRFPARLDISETSPLVKMEKYSLSATLLALILINGEIFQSRDNDSILHHTLQSYIVRNETMITVSHLRKPQSFVDRCRFRSPTITKHGLETQGWIFRLFHTPNESPQDKEARCIKLTQTERADIKSRRDDDASQARDPRSILNALEKEVAVTIISRLQSRWPRCRLTDLLYRSLSVDRDPPPKDEEDPATTITLKMMSAVVQALIQGLEVRLACLHSQPEHSPPSAMFVAPYYGFNQAWPPHVFTSWDNPPNSHRRERLASLLVSAHDTHKRAGYGRRLSEGDVLKHYSWVNGVWDGRGEPLETYIFPFIDCVAVARGTKRKRNQGLDSPPSDY
jgi:hypothetical protein